MVKLCTKHLSDSVDLFDESSADNTGHVLAALGAYGMTLGSSRAVTRATAFCVGPGSWHGSLGRRWGINTLYGTTQAGTGLLRAGESPQAPYLQRAARTLMSFQNADGGFGESTLSYLDAGHRGRGASTPTQTAWVLEFLCQMGLQHADTVPRSSITCSKPGRVGILAGRLVVGTGHPGILYMEYPAYPKTFPVMALANYLNPRAANGMEAHCNRRDLKSGNNISPNKLIAMSNTAATYLHFFWAGLVKHGQTGGIVPSQRFLIAKMIAPVPEAYRGQVIELERAAGPSLCGSPRDVRPRESWRVRLTDFGARP